MTMPRVLLAADAGRRFAAELESFLVAHSVAVEPADLNERSTAFSDRINAALAIVGFGHDSQSAIYGLQCAARLQGCFAHLPMIAVIEQSSEQLAIEALRAGFSDYVKWPSGDELLASIRRHTPLDGEPRSCRVQDAASPRDIDQYLIGESAPMRHLKRYLANAALAQTSVLITGETGTGKERVAELIHFHSARSAKRLIDINCAAIPESLIEGELFGYEKGAFTGASARYEGKLKLAEGGTVFFDEIGEMSLLAQAKILRAIESKEVYRLGGKSEVSLDFRVVAATNCDLETMIAKGGFRKDLYYRLNVARMHLPPLRERKEDIALLAQDYISALSQRFGTAVTGIDPRALELLMGYDWPGNVRELRNVIEAAFINRPSRRLRCDDLPESFVHAVERTADVREPDQRERDALVTALSETNWNKSEAARKLNWSRMTVYRKMQKFGIEDRQSRKADEATVTSAL